MNLNTVCSKQLFRHNLLTSDRIFCTIIQPYRSFSCLQILKNRTQRYRVSLPGQIGYAQHHFTRKPRINLIFLPVKSTVSNSQTNRNTASVRRSIHKFLYLSMKPFSLVSIKLHSYLHFFPCQPYICLRKNKTNLQLIRIH